MLIMNRILILFCFMTILISCEERNDFPTLSQVAISDITNNSVFISCLVTDNGNSFIDSIGICLSVNVNPTVENQVYIKENANELKYMLTGLIPKTKYFIRAFTINEKGLYYGKETSLITKSNDTDIFVDERDGQEYKIVKIGEDWWFAENLNYRVKNSWYYNEDSLNYSLIGRLYSYESALIAVPKGWRLPTDNDWVRIEREIGMETSEQYELSVWRGIGLANLLLTDGEYDFNVNWSGKRDTSQAFIYSYEDHAFFWSSTKFKNGYAEQYNYDSYYGREFAEWSESIKRTVLPEWYGCSIRCIKE